MAVADGFEVYIDPSYYDMWAVRPIGETEFIRTLHFAKKGEAISASYVIAFWMGNFSDAVAEAVRIADLEA